MSLVATASAQTQTALAPTEAVQLIGGLPLAASMEAAEAAIAACKRDGASVSVVILDEKGTVRLVEVSDGATAGRWMIAQRKATTVLDYRMDGLALMERMGADTELAGRIAADATRYHPRTGGGRLIRVAGRIVGAIGVSGAATLPPPGPPGWVRDDACAAAGLERISGELR